MASSMIASGITATGGSRQRTAWNEITEYKKLFNEGMIDKEQMKEAIGAIIAEQCKKARHEEVDSEVSKARRLTKQALARSGTYREGASPETQIIRRVLEGPLLRRFKMQCATPDSMLWGKVPPRRLNEALFNVAVQEPLEQIFTRHAPELQNVPAEKVTKIAKWKLRKMRANLNGRKDPMDFVFDDDGFDFEEQARLIKPVQSQISMKSAFKPVQRKNRLVDLTPTSPPVDDQAQRSTGRKRKKSTARTPPIRKRGKKKRTTGGRTTTAAVTTPPAEKRPRRRKKRNMHRRVVATTPPQQVRTTTTPPKKATPTPPQATATTTTPPKKATPTTTTPRATTTTTTTPPKKAGPRVTTTPPPTLLFKPNDKVMALWAPDNKYYPATVTKSRTYKNGSVKYRVSSSYIHACCIAFIAHIIHTHHLLTSSPPPSFIIGVVR